MRLLIAEDDKTTAATLQKRLQEARYAVDVCHDGEEAWAYLQAAEYDVAVLDIMMPGLDGLSLVRKMRRAGMRAPVLLLTAKDAVADRVEGLNAGADDYLTKPFAFEELSARLNALTRRGGGQASNQFEAGDLILDAGGREVRRGGRAIALTSREYALLEYMIRNKGHVLSRGQIEQHVWSYAYEGASNMVDVYIRSLRKKIDEGTEKKLIHTVRYAGYVLKEEA